jgi:ADP-heptose:LPS heptosyltransferase
MKILLIKRGAIGDLLLATPLIRQLKQKLNCNLDIIVGKSASAALIANPYIDKQFILSDESFTIRGTAKLARTLLNLRKQYDYVFVLDKNWYFNCMAQLVSAKAIGYTRDRVSSLVLYKKIVYNDVNRYHGLYYLDLLKVSQLFDVDYTDLDLDLVVGTTDKLVVEEFIFRNKLTNYVVVVNSGGNNSYEQDGLRMLPMIKIIELVKLLLERGNKVLLLGAKVDQMHYQKICASFPDNHNLYNLAGKFNLAASSYLIGRSAHFYTTDCGAMHLGVAAGALERMTAFFGPSNPAHILPAKWLSQVAVWQDAGIYSPNYQLNGSRQKQEPKYFTKLDPQLYLY